MRASSDDARLQLLNLLHKNQGITSEGRIDYDQYAHGMSPVMAEIHTENQGYNVHYASAIDYHQQQQQIALSAEGAPIFMSKAINITGLPFDMTPKELYDIFGEVGGVEGCYIYPYLDNHGRRFGYVVMTSFYNAQEVCI